MSRFACPTCGAPLAASAGQPGATGACPHCGARYAVPPAADSPAAGLVPIDPCPGCRAPLSVPPADVGADVECPYCMTVYRAARGDADPPVAPPRRSSRRAADERDDDRPSRRRSRRDDEDDEDDDRPRRSRRRAWEPSQVRAVGGILLGGGIYGAVHALGVALGSGGICCLWPGTWFEIVWAVLAIVRATAVTNGDHSQGPPTTLLTLQIVTILNGDVINCVLGIVGLSLMNADEVRDYYRRRGF